MNAGKKRGGEARVKTTGRRGSIVLIAGAAAIVLAAGFWFFRDRSSMLNHGAASGLQTNSVIHPDVSTSETGVQAHIRETRAVVNETISTNASATARAAAWAQLGRVYFAYEFYPAAANCF